MFLLTQPCTYPWHLHCISVFGRKLYPDCFLPRLNFWAILLSWANLYPFASCLLKRGKEIILYTRSNCIGSRRYSVLPHDVLPRRRKRPARIKKIRLSVTFFILQKSGEAKIKKITVSITPKTHMHIQTQTCVSHTNKDRLGVNRWDPNVTLVDLTPLHGNGIEVLCFKVCYVLPEFSFLDHYKLELWFMLGGLHPCPGKSSRGRRRAWGHTHKSPQWKSHRCI